MRNLSPERRRIAVICGACAAIIPSAALMMNRAHSPSMQFVGGFIVGMAVVLSIATLVRSRRSRA